MSTCDVVRVGGRRVVVSSFSVVVVIVPWYYWSPAFYILLYSLSAILNKKYFSIIPLVSPQLFGFSVHLVYAASVVCRLATQLIKFNFSAPSFQIPNN